MLALLSPAKKLDFDSEPRTDAASQPELLQDAKRLVKQAKTLTSADLQSMMKISEKLADLNVQRFRDFKPPFDLANARQAALTFAGDTYIGLDARSFDDADLDYAQEHLRILSGLYGLLRPLDLIQAYRLEMGTRFAFNGHETLYDFWGTKISKAINAVTADHKHRAVINLASNEYAKAVDLGALDGTVITPVFKEEKDGESRVLGLFAKQARGMMARYMIQNRIDTPEKLKSFSMGGYRFQSDLSDDQTWVFTRPQPAKKIACAIPEPDFG
jgi:cytoplasmic iron level regulating protein YaaA (DUF328/UPF0246 family)